MSNTEDSDLDQFIHKEETNDIEDETINEVKEKPKETVNNKVINFIQSRMKKRSRQEENFSEEEKVKYKQFREKQIKMVQRKNFRTSMNERLAEAYHKYKYSNNNQNADDLVTFLSYLKSASERANMKIFNQEKKHRGKLR